MHILCDNLPLVLLTPAIVVLAASVGCRSDREPATATAQSPTAETSPGTPVPAEDGPKVHEEDDDGQDSEAEAEPKSENADAIELATTFRDKAGNEDFPNWLVTVATYPFDVDGKTTANDAETLKSAFAEELADLDEQVAGKDHCEAATRSALLQGQPWHWLDRLGQRPERGVLEKDLERLGVTDDDVLVNCYDDGPGFTVLVRPHDDELRIAMFRN